MREKFLVLPDGIEYKINCLIRYIEKNKKIIAELEQFILYKNENKITQKQKNKNLTRCGRRLSKGSHSVRNVVQCKSTTKKRKAVLKEQLICQNAGCI